MFTSLIVLAWLIAITISAVPPLGRWIYVRIPGVEFLWQLEAMLYPGLSIRLDSPVETKD